MKTKELIEYLQGFDAESEVVVITANPIWIRKRSRQQYRMKERQSRNEFEIRKAK